MFENYKVFKTQFAGREISFEVGKMAGLSTSSVLVRFGESVVMVNATVAKSPREGMDFFPLSVDFEEKLYAIGRIPGSFMKREGRPSEKSVLTSRLIDRSIRPLFAKDMRNDVTVVMTVMSVDPDCQPEIAGMLGTSFALATSSIPWAGPISGINVGLVDGEIVLNPDLEQREKSGMMITAVSTENLIAMIETGANQIPEETIIKGIEAAHEENKKMVAFINGVVAEIGQEKLVFETKEVDEGLYSEVKDFIIEDLRVALDTDDKATRDLQLAPLYDKVHAEFDEKYPENIGMIGEIMYKLQKFVVRRWLLDDGKRVDGRGLDEVRPLASEVGLLPRVHGSGMFTRGQTQVLTIATLGTLKEAQIVDGIDEIKSKRYMHQYNFPSYSVGETRPSRGPGRREIGHGALAEKALLPVIPSIEDFPYAYRLVSEVLSSNGSTSQGAICGSTLALMDAGVPIKAPVAGISCGLVTEGDRWMTMVDIQGLEDFFGDMDFKVGGTHTGITAIQMDTKVHGLTMEIVKEAIEKCRIARLSILDDVMLKAIEAPRTELSKYAPKMIGIKISVDKIRDVIGKGGAVIQKICADCDVKVDIEDDGNVFVSGIDIDKVNRALSIINMIVNDPEVGALYKGKVTRIMNFGAFVEIAPGKEGLVHISKLAPERVGKVEDIVSVGDAVVVKVLEIDDQGRLNLSRKDALADMEAKKKD